MENGLGDTGLATGILVAIAFLLVWVAVKRGSDPAFAPLVVQNRQKTGCKFLILAIEGI